MNRNRNTYSNKSVSFIKTIFFILAYLAATVYTQNKINSVWLNYDNSLRNNAQDRKLKDILNDANLKEVTPTPSGLKMLYALADGKEAEVIAKFSAKGEVLSSRLNIKKQIKVARVSDEKVLQFAQQILNNRLPKK